MTPQKSSPASWPNVVSGFPRKRPLLGVVILFDLVAPPPPLDSGFSLLLFSESLLFLVRTPDWWLKTTLRPSTRWMVSKSHHFLFDEPVSRRFYSFDLSYPPQHLLNVVIPPRLKLLFFPLLSFFFFLFIYQRRGSWFLRASLFLLFLVRFGVMRIFFYVWISCSRE